MKHCTKTATVALLAATLACLACQRDGGPARSIRGKPETKIFSVVAETPVDFAYKRLGTQVQSNVRQTKLPGEIRFEIADVPTDAVLSFGAATTPHPSPFARTTLSVIAKSQQGGTSTVLEETLSNSAHRVRPAPPDVVTHPASKDLRRLSNRAYGKPWIAARPGTAPMLVTFDEPVPLTAFLVSSPLGYAARASRPSRVKVELSSDGENYDPPFELDRRPGLPHWFWLPGTPVKTMRLTFFAHNDDLPVAIDELIFTTEQDRESIPDQLGRWLRFRIDLAAFAGQSVELVFRFDSIDAPIRRANSQGWLSEPILTTPRAAGERNLVLVSLDTVRADRMSAYGYDRRTTPFLEELSDRPGSVSFSNARSTSTWTTPSHIAMMTGRTPYEIQVNATRAHLETWTKSEIVQTPLDPQVATLASTLRDQGYLTSAFASAGGTSADLGLGHGFHLYDDPWDQDPLRVTDFNGALVPKVTRIGQWLETHREDKFFLFLHTYVAHTMYKDVDFAPCGDAEDPLEPCQQYLRYLYPASNRIRRGSQQNVRKLPRTLLRSVNAGLMSDFYDSGLSRADRFAASIIEHLDRLDLAEDTVVIITSDHGEGFAEHHRKRFTGIHGFGFYDEYLRIPMIFVVPGLRSTVRSDVPTSLIDIAPTALDLLGVNPPHVSGRSLLPLIEQGEHDFDERTIFYEVLSDEEKGKPHFIAASRGRFKVLANPYNLHDGEHALFDTIEDPGEATDLASTQEETAKAMLADLDHHLAAVLAGMVVVDVSNLGSSSKTEIAGEIVFDSDVRYFDLATRHADESVVANRAGEGQRYRFRLRPHNERRLLAFRPVAAPELSITYKAEDTAGDCSVHIGDAPVALEAETVRSSEIRASAVPLQTERGDGACSVKVYTAGDLSPTISSAQATEVRGLDEMPEEARERVREQMEALGYLDN